MFKDVKGLVQLRNGLFKRVQINFRKVFLKSHCSHRHIYKELQLLLWTS